MKKTSLLLIIGGFLSIPVISCLICMTPVVGSCALASLFPFVESVRTPSSVTGVLPATKTPKPVVSSTVESTRTIQIPTAIRTITATEVESTQEISPKNQVEKTSTPFKKQADLIIDVKNIIGKRGADVKKILGSPEMITSNDDEDDDYAGGEYWDYTLSNYSTFFILDKNSIVRGFQVMDGLSEENYSLDDWKELLPQFGLSSNTPPDRTAQAAYYWDNLSGYKVAIMSSNITGEPVWTVQVLDAYYP